MAPPFNVDARRRLTAYLAKGFHRLQDGGCKTYRQITDEVGAVSPTSICTWISQDHPEVLKEIQDGPLMRRILEQARTFPD